MNQPIKVLLFFFSLVIFVVIIIRLFMILGGKMDIFEKISKIYSWIAGIVLLGFSWAVINWFFPQYNIGSPFKKIELNEKLKDENFQYKKNTRTSEQDSVHIRIDMGEKNKKK